VQLIQRQTIASVTVLIFVPFWLRFVQRAVLQIVLDVTLILVYINCFM